MWSVVEVKLCHENYNIEPYIYCITESNPDYIRSYEFYQLDLGRWDIQWRWSGEIDVIIRGGKRITSV